MTTKHKEPVYIVDGSRTPFLKVRGKPGAFSASDLAVAASQQVLLRSVLEPTDIDEVVVGCVMPRENEANIARVVALRLGCADYIPAWTVQRNCGSGMQALDAAQEDIASGRYSLVLAGGTEAMSRSPLLFSDSYINWLGAMRSASIQQRLKLLLKWRPQYMKPIFALEKGLCDPLVGLSMGQTAENLAYQFHIHREEMDKFALQSHQKVSAAQKKGYLDEVMPVFDRKGSTYTEDTGVRPDSSLEKLASLSPFFDRFGTITAGNSSQVTDGAAMLLLANKDAIKKHNLPILGRIVDSQWAALSPAVMGLGPVFAATPLMLRNNLKFDDISYFEINEAFAAQVLACLKAWESDEFCQKHFATPALGQLPLDRLNVDGGAIALGHPVGASGARIVLHLLHILKRNNARYGLASICIGGGQGGAMLIERTTELQ